MGKLNRYNQKLLAILGTLAVVFLLCFMIFLCFHIIEDYRRNLDWENHPNAITLEVNRDDQNNKLRDQVITFNNPQLIDSSQSIYMIPVSTIDLKNPERADFNELSNLLDTYEPLPEYGISVSGEFTGVCNNIIIHQQITGEQEAVFDEKVNVSYINNYVIEENQYILIRAVNQDTNKDLKLSNSDLSSFFCYDLDNRKLSSINIPNHSLIDYAPIYNTNEVLIRMGFDKNEDGKFDPGSEPVVLKAFSVVTNQLRDLIKPELYQQLQKLIDE